MKKLTLALIASAVTVSAASAHGSINSGFYLGAAVGYGATTGKESGQAGNVPINGSQDIGGNAANIGIHGGYGWVSGCLYVGGEVAYTFENTKINGTLGQGQVGAAGGSQQLKRNGYFGAALRAGFLVMPNTMGYIRLGGNIGKWTLTDSLNVGFSPTNTARGTKSRLSFAPGVGIETAIHRNIYLRAEYSYEFGPSVRATNGNVPNSFVQVSRIRTQSGKVGLSYKF